MPSTLIALATAAGAAISAGSAAFAAGFTLANAVTFALKATALMGLNYLLRRREPEVGAGDVQSVTRSQTFSSGPARWVLGRARVGGVVAYWGEDWNVPRTDRGPDDGAASDVHMILTVSEGVCDKLEAIWVGETRLDVLFNPLPNGQPDPEKRVYQRRRYRNGDSQITTEGLPLVLAQENLAWYDIANDVWRDTNPYEPVRDARVLNEDDDDDAEKIRAAKLAQAISVWPYFNPNGPYNWRSVRNYSARDWPSDNGEDDLFGAEIQANKDWTTNHQLKDISGVHIKMRQWNIKSFDDRVFKGGIPNMSFLVRGIQFNYPDPNDATSTIFGWTNNAAAIRYWWLTERLGILSDNINRDNFVRAFNICETKITPTLPDFGDDPPDWANDDNLVSFRKYSINGILQSGEKPSRVEREFDDAWQGSVVEEGGQLHFYPGAEQIEAGSVDGNDLLLGYPAVITPAPSLAQRVNAVSITIQQSTFHNFNQYSLRTIEDIEKRDKTDLGEYLQQDLGTWRWLQNPAAAYMVGLINLRRARSSMTIQLTLPPGTSDDPTKYLAMSAGKNYIVDIPQDNIDERPMQLLEKQIHAGTDGLRVDAVFVDAPSDIYDPSYKLPAIEDPPPYTPTRIGARPAKPTNLVAEPTGRVNDDGTYHFRIKASVDTTPIRKIFRLFAGDDEWSVETAESEFVFEISAPLGPMRLQARTIDKYGVQSLPINIFFTPSYKAVEISMPRPRFKAITVHSANLFIQIESEAYNAPISGVELRFQKEDLDTTTPVGTLTEDTWKSGTVLQADPVQPVRGLDTFINGVVKESGRYNIYARYTTSISGQTETRGPLSAPFYLVVEVPEIPVVSFEETPDWDGTLHNLYQWNSTGGITEGQPMILPSHTSTGPVKDDTSIRYAHWNGNVNVSGITPRAAWPFGECEGFDEALVANDRNAQGLLKSTIDKTWYRTKPEKLGGSKTIQARGEVFEIAPGTSAISNLTFGDSEILDQQFSPNAAIRSITLPAATNGTGTISYSLTGQPSGVSFNPSTRVLSGTTQVGSGSGTMTYTATDTGGGNATLTFNWLIVGSIVSPITVSQPTVSNITRTGATVSWTAIAGVNFYELETTPSGGSAATISSIEATSYALVSLASNTSHSVRVRGVNQTGPGSFSTATTFTTLAAATTPSTPTGVTITSVATGLIVRWASDSNVSSYDLRYKKNSEASYPVANLETGIGANTFTIDLADLELSTLYNVQIRARNESANPSGWSTAKSATTVAAPPSAPTITGVTEASTSLYDSLLVSVTAVPNTQRTIFEVTGTPSRGAYTGTVTRNFNTAIGPFELRFVEDGVSYSIVAYAQLFNGQFTANSAPFVYVKGNVPEKVAGLTAGTITTSSIPLTWTADSNATGYTVTYYPQADPSNVFTATSTSASYTITGLDDATSYSITVLASNATGDGLASDPLVATTLTAPLAAPAAPTGLTTVVHDAGEVELDWTASPTAENYEVRQSPTDTMPITGIVDDLYVYTGLSHDTAYTFQIRARNTAGVSAWTNFAAVTTPPETTANPYDEITNFTATPNSPNGIALPNNKTLDISFQAKGRAAVEYYQIRYREDPNRTDLYSRRLTAWRYIRIDQSATSGTQTITYSLVSPISNAALQLEVRAYLNADDTGTPSLGSKGFGSWVAASRIHTSGLVGQPTITPITITPSQHFDDDDNIVYQANWDPDTSQIENPDAGLDFQYIRIDARIEYRASAGASITTIRLAASDMTVTDDDGNVLTVQPTDRRGVFRYPIDAARVEFSKASLDASYNELLDSHGIVFSESPTVILRLWKVLEFMNINRPPNDVRISNAYTIQNAITAPREIRSNEYTYSYNGSDAVITWEPVAEADGYQVRIYDFYPDQAAPQRLSSIVQTSTATSYTKPNGVNEIFNFDVFPYKGSGSDRVFSHADNGFGNGFPSLNFPRHQFELPILTGLQGGRNATSTSIQWDENNFPASYQRQFITSIGADWSSISTQSTTSFVLTSTQAPHNGFLNVRVRNTNGRGWSTISYKNDTSPTPGTPSDIRTLVAIPRDDGIMLGWGGDINSITGASKLVLETSTSSTFSPKETVNNNIPTTTTNWETSYARGTDRYFRIRGENDEGVAGAWTSIKYTGEAAIAVGTISNLTPTATYSSINASWDAATNAEEYEVQYKKHADSTWTTFVTNNTDRNIAISGLDTGTRYNLRVRGKNGTATGNYATNTTINTLSCVGLTAPTPVLTTSWNDIRVSWNAITGATIYEVEISVGNTVHLTKRFGGTEATIKGNELPNVVRPGNVSARVKAIHSDCPNSEFSSKVTQAWQEGSDIHFSGSGRTGQSSIPYLLAGTTGEVEQNWFKREGRTTNQYYRHTPQRAGEYRVQIRWQNSDNQTNIGTPNNTAYFRVWTTARNAHGRLITIEEKRVNIEPTDTSVSISIDVSDPRFRRLNFQFFADRQLYPYPDKLPLVITIEAPPPSGSTGTIQSAIAGSAAGGAIAFDTGNYAPSTIEPPAEEVRPYLYGHIQYQIWKESTAIENYTLPTPVGGKQPYKCLVSGLPGGISFDEETLTFSGTPSSPAPVTGYATINLIDSNDLHEVRYMPWAVATAAQPGPSIGSGFGVEVLPYEIHCLLAGNMKAYVGSRQAGGTNAADIMTSATARHIVTWFQCPSRGKKIARLRGAAAQDWDLVVKIGTNYYFSDTDDDIEYIEYDDSDHTNGALIGLYRYSATTVSSGLSTNTDPIILEWAPQIELPTEISGQVGGASASGNLSTEPEGANVPDGDSETDIYLLYRNSDSAVWSNIKVGSSWSSSVTATEIAFEAHLKKWRNRAMIRMNTAYRIP